MPPVKRIFGKTKIVCTLGPASGTADVVTAMIREGMDVARINFSHGTHEEHRRTLRLIRSTAKKTGEPVTIIQDLQGPKIRIGELNSDRNEHFFKNARSALRP